MSSLSSELEFPAQLSELHRVRNFVREQCRHFIPDKDWEAWIEQLELATHEAASNIVRHSCPHLPAARIRLRLDRDETRVVLQFTHPGLPFDPASIAIPQPHPNREGGFGRFILSKYLDEITYQTLAPETKIIRLVKSFPSPAAPGSMKGVPTMALETRMSADILIVEIPVPQFETEKSASVKKELQPLLEKHHKILFDLGKVQFIDSSGLGVLLSAFRHINARGGEMKLTGLNRQIRSLIELVRMHRVFEIFPTVEEALAAFKR